jgi:predicted RNA methylase
MNEMANRGNSAAQVALATIKGEPGSKPSWLLVAKTAEEIRRSGKWSPDYTSPTEWLEAVADASGHTVNTIRRFIASLKFLEGRDKKTRAEVLDPFSGTGKLAMASVELIKRIHDISPTQADKVLQQHIKDELTVREIREFYDSMIHHVQPQTMMIVTSPPFFSKERWPSPDAGKLGLRRAHQDKRVLTDIVRKEISVLSDTNAAKVFSDRYEFDFVSPDIVAVGQEDFSVSFVDGFEMKKLGSRVPPGAFKKAIAEIVFSATFFRRYWVILEGFDNAAESITSALDKLEAASVGVALVDLDRKSIRIHRKPTALPQPDRHDLARSAILAQGIPASP